MTTATVSTPVAAVKQTAGDIAIAKAQVAGHSNATLLKAVWSTRGNIRVQTPGFEFGIACIKSDLTGMLKVLPGDERSVFILKPMADGGAELIVAPAADVQA
jgi:hypothetical protein